MNEAEKAFNMNRGPWGLAWINRRYGLSLRPGSPVFQPSSGRRGIVTGVMPGHSDCLLIRWHGYPQAHGPFAPTEGLEYPDAPRLI